MRIFSFFILLLTFSCSFAVSLQTLVYTDGDASNYSVATPLLIHSLEQNGNKIAIFAPQVYQMTQNGLIVGSLDSRLLKIAKAKKIKVMPLIINSGFNPQLVHAFLNNETAKTRAINNMLQIAMTNGYYGFQFDFENISIEDRDAYTYFVAKVAEVMHKNGLVLSLAIIAYPKSSEIDSSYKLFLYKFYRGAYDLKKLADYADFLSLMTYDQHTTNTTPGPIAALPWMKEILTSLLKIVPANKISLGIPAYSGLWRTGMRGKHFQAVRLGLSYQEVMEIVKKYNLKLKWDDNTQSAYTVYNQNHLYEYLFIENAKSFEAKLNLAERYHLRGISIWKMGSEDPAIWMLLNNA